MNPQNPYKSAIEPPIQNPLSVVQPGEQIICEIKRDPIGMVTMYAAAGIIIFVLSILAFGVAPSIMSGSSRSEVMSISLIAILTASLFISAFLFISHKVYWGNSWILTTDSLIQVTQTSLFDKQSAQLSLEHVEDVSSSQDGLLTHLFNYGTVAVETAAATDKFTFNYCPTPNYYARQIVAAREQLERSRNEATKEQLQQPTQPQPVYQAPTQPPVSF